MRIKITIIALLAYAYCNYSYTAYALAIVSFIILIITKLIKVRTEGNDTEVDLKIFGKTILYAVYGEKIGWFKLFGLGLMWKHKEYGLSFSQREGIKKYITINNYIVSWL